jgi:hypothetical protein
VVQSNDSEDIAAIFDKASGEHFLVLPPATTRRNFPLLVLGLDQGSLGAAGAAYLEEERRMMVWCKWDKYHRCIRDINLSISHSARGLFLKAQLFTGYLWSVNFKPFGTGTMGTKKREALDFFLATTQEDSAIFLEYGPRIAKDNKLNFDTESDRLQVYERLPDIATSFRRSTEMCKLGRWFSWNDCAKHQLSEFWAAKMILEHFFALTDGADDPDEVGVALDAVNEVGKCKTPQE